MLKHLPSSFAWLAAFFAALGTLFFVIGLHTAYRNWQFSGTVEHTIGNVTGRHFTVHHSRRGGTSYTYSVQYTYFDLSGTQFVSNATVVSSTYYGLTAPGGVPLKYLPASHSVNRIDLPAEDASYSHQAWLFTSLGGAFGGFGWYSFIGLERLIFYRRWLRKNGIRCTGRIERLESTSITMNKRTVHYLVYSYIDPTGQEREGTSEGLTAAEDELWRDGQPIPVFCDPRDASRSAAAVDRR